MEAIISAAITAGVKLIELIFLGVRAKELSKEEIFAEIDRIEKRETSIVAEWWKIVG